MFLVTSVCSWRARVNGSRSAENNSLECLLAEDAGTRFWGQLHTRKELAYLTSDQ